MGFGDYPKGYNRNIHGPYDPARYYGPSDTPFGDVRLGDLPGWLRRRSWNPADWVSAGSRAYWRWLHKWIFTRRPSAVGLYQYIFVTSSIGYILSYKKHQAEINYKYH